MFDALPEIARLPAGEDVRLTNRGLHDRKRGIAGMSLAAAGLLLSLAMPGIAVGDNCMMDLWDNGTVTALPSDHLFPNWSRVWLGSYDVWLCRELYCGTAAEYLKGITVVNFGTAGAGEISQVYFRARCGGGAGDTGLVTMTYAGMYTLKAGTEPAWTWAGTSPNYAGCGDLCGVPACGAYFVLDIYADIASCPAELSTVKMGFDYMANQITATAWEYAGPVTDSVGCQAPYYGASGKEYDIRYVTKEGADFAAPGDTISYTIVYGRPGTTSLSRIVVVDTQPPYTHYVPGSASPNPDPGWDPLIGTPPVLKWTINGPLAVTGGPTGMVTMDLSVDWGNGEGFEPGSGDVAAPEGIRLDNRAVVEFVGVTGCGQFWLTPVVKTAVRRYLFWKIGDNDVLFAPRIGMPDDEMIYTLYIKNSSAYKTWWNVSIWDSVPAELDPWAPSCGFDDPCIGWTMTPTGCSAASPGNLKAGGVTILTWKLNMSPLLTLTLKWKARVRATAPADSTAINRASIMALGRPGVVEGTGHATTSRNFMHSARIALRTTYVTYGGIGVRCDDYVEYGGENQSYHIHFFPLNKMTDMDLRKQEHCVLTPDAFAASGGVSPSIVISAGTCIGGFPDGGWAGCKAERIPAAYWPAQFTDIKPPLPCHNVYKVVSNSPFIWEIMNNIEDASADRHGYTMSTNLSHSGNMHYTYLQRNARDYAGEKVADELTIANTDLNVPTSALVFQWDVVGQTWDFMDLAELGPGAVWSCYAGVNWGEANYRVMSSDTPVVIWRTVWDGARAERRGVAHPLVETGNLVSTGVLPQTFQVFACPDGWQAGTGVESRAQLAVINVGSVAADYDLWRYFCLGSFSDRVSAGYWNIITTNNVPAGFNAAANPHIYGASYDAGAMQAPWTKTERGCYRIVQKTAGAALEVIGWNDLSSSFACGSTLHDINGNLVGNEFWLTQTWRAEYCGVDNKGCCGGPGLYTLDLFCPTTGSVVSTQSTDGYSATYVTTGPDQVVSFQDLTDITTATRRNVRTTVGGPSGARAFFQFIHSELSERYYTPPFVSTGVFYTIITPPIVYVGQSFWITIVVTETGGATKADYNGVTSFSSTDPGAKLEGTGMAGYDYDWVGDTLEKGVKVFVNVTMTTIGFQSIMAQDTQDGSISGLAPLMVVAADVKLSKEPKYAIASSGEQIQFRVCWSNYSSATAANFVITDAVPMGTSYVPEAASLMFCGAGGPATPGVIVAYGTASATTPATFNTLTSPTQTAPATTRWLRWTIQDVFVHSTGCVCFRVLVL